MRLGRRQGLVAVAAVWAGLLLGHSAHGGTLGTDFTYQGRLKQAGAPVTGDCDLEFRLYDDPDAGAQVGSTQTVNDHPVTNGLFTAPLDFGAGAFDGTARWLEIAVQGPGGGGYTTLTPRQKLTATPYALFALQAPWSGLSGIPAGFDDGTDDVGWALTGNAGTSPATDFLGTLDATPLVLRVNNEPALRLEPNATSPNLIGGHGANSITAGVVGATLSGGGETGFGNRVTDDYGTIGGGRNNQAGDGAGTTADRHWATVAGGVSNTASGDASTVGGGVDNVASGQLSTVAGCYGNQAQALASFVGGGYENEASAGYATVGGGGWNKATADYATVGGGYQNTASGWRATIAGGFDNQASGEKATVAGGELNAASGEWAAVGGGKSNTASGKYSFAAGRRAKANHDGAFVWADSTDADFASTADNQLSARATGGVRLLVDTDGGGLRLEPNATSPNLIGGYSGNTVTAGVVGATLSGGGQPGYPNRITGEYGTVGGGSGNTVSASWATAGGGGDNTASGTYATVAGGNLNEAGGQYSFAAGRRAKASHDGAFVWADSTDADFASTANDQFLIRASGGVGIGTPSPEATLHVQGDARVTGSFHDSAGSPGTLGQVLTSTGTGTAWAAVGTDLIADGAVTAAKIAPNIVSSINAVVNDGGDIALVGGGGISISPDDGANTITIATTGAGADAWILTGNSGTNPATHFLGTSDNQPLVLKVNAQQALRLEPTATSPNLIGGHSANSVAAGVVGATISGGGTTGYENVVSANYATVGGGLFNTATADYATVGGGEKNTANGWHCTVGGGDENTASGWGGTVGGGWGNTTTGGDFSTVAGGQYNTASWYYATVGGGQHNAATQAGATVPGGHSNTAAGEYSFAAGRRAKANNLGAFAWADSTDADFEVSVKDRFGARASGGVYLYTKSDLTTGSYLAANSGTWASVSDRDAKADIQAVEPRAVLERLAAVPVATWRYKGEDASIRHMGPMAQDLHAAFGLGDSERSIGTLDADGIALAAIQGLHSLVREKEAQLADMAARLDHKDGEIAELQDQAAEKGAKVAGLEQRLAKLEALMATLALAKTENPK